MDTNCSLVMHSRHFNTGDPIKRKESLFVRMQPDGVPGEPRGVWVQLLKQSMDWLMAQESGGTVSLLQPEVWGSRHPSWNRGERDNFAVVRWCRQQMDPCVFGSLLTSRAWTLCPLGN